MTAWVVSGAGPENAVWAWLFFTTAGFFFVAGQRYGGRGFALLGLALGCIAIAQGALACLGACGASRGGFFAARLASSVGVCAAAFNVHFLYVYFRAPGSNKVAWSMYVLVGAAALANLTISVAGMGDLSSLNFPSDYLSPSPAFSWYLVATAVVHYALLVPLAFARRREHAPHPGRLLVAAMAPAPLLLLDASIARAGGQRWFLAEAGMWLYALVVIGNLIAEIRRAEGLLRETTSSLAERTRELESSYAEMDLMASELSRKQQLAAVGELAAAIAHEVRNPLAIIMNATSGLRRSHLGEEDRTTLLDIVNEESARLNHLVEELLRFARPVTASRGPASLFDMCVRVSQSPPDGFSLVVTTAADDDLGPVLVDPGLFRLALDNLIANSCQAMPQGGRIELSVVKGAFSDQTPAARVEVRDFGVGMGPEELERARKPFFTTKPRGTGLGIPIVDRIVEAHGGEMEIDSEPGQGTRVSILLPIEKELQKSSTTFSAGRTASGRRRLRSIPPG